MTIAPERRQLARATLSSEAVIHAGTECIACRVLDVGPGGIAVRTPWHHPPEAPLHVVFALDDGGQRIRAHGVLVKKERVNGDAIWRIRFHALDSASWQRLDAFVSRKTKGPGGASAGFSRGSSPALASPSPEPRRRPGRAPDYELLQLYRDALAEVSGKGRKPR